MTDVNVLEFKLINPLKSGEKWENEFTSRKVTEIYIDGKEILDILLPIETSYKDPKDIQEKGCEYGHLAPSSLFGSLSDAMIPWADCVENEFYLCYCGSCGEPGCWSVSAKVKVEENCVIWYDFEHSHKDWKYNLRYRFDRTQYESALKKLDAMAKNRKIKRMF